MELEAEFYKSVRDHSCTVLMRYVHACIYAYTHVYTYVYLFVSIYIE